MGEVDRISSLIGDIYDAALDPSLWESVLAQSAQFVGGPAAALFSKDAAGKTGNAAYYYGIEPDFVQIYFDKYIKLDPTSTALFFATIEEPMAAGDLVRYDEFVATRFYREWAQPQGLVDCVNVVLEKSVTSIAAFNVFRHQRDGLVDDETRRRMALLAPHVRRAVLIGRVIDLKTAEAATFADSLDGLSAGMLLVDETSRIVHANASGHVMLAEGSVLRATAGKLTANEADAEQALNEIFAMAGSGDAAVGVKGIAVPLTARDGERYVAHVLPLTSGERRRAGASYAAVAALFVHKTALEAPSPPEVIAKTFRLTPSELRILLAIVEVGGVPEVAESLGIAESTVKTHLGNLYQKTGARRQADLVKIVAGFSMPLLG